MPTHSATSRPTLRTIDAGGIRWSVEERGAGPTVVLLHGTGGTVRTWDALAPLLDDRVHLVALDLPGHGGTSYPGFEHITCASISALVASALAVLGAVPAGVVAHSAGAAIMLEMAATGVLPAGAVLVGINSALQPPGAAARRLMHGPVGDLVRSRVARSMVRGVGRFAPMIELLLASTGSRLTPAQEGEYVAAFAGKDHAEAAFAMMANWDLLPLHRALPTVKQETLFIVGTSDPWIPPEVSQQAAGLMPRARVAPIPRAGHLVHEERPAEVAALIAGALGTCPSRPMEVQ